MSDLASLAWWQWLAIGFLFGSGWAAGEALVKGIIGAVRK